MPEIIRRDCFIGKSPHARISEPYAFRRLADPPIIR
jgi:hypothetical protein